MNNSQLACLELDTVTGEVVPIEFKEANEGFSKAFCKVLEHGDFYQINKFIARHKMHESTRNHVLTSWKIIQEMR